MTTGVVFLSGANDGTLAYVPDTGVNRGLRRLAWVDPAGTVSPLPLQPDVYNDARISPDGGRIALLVGSTGSGDVWVFDIAKELMTRLTFDTKNATPTWSPDGRYIYYANIDDTGTKTTLMRRRSDGSRDAEPLGSLDTRAYLRDFYAGGSRMLIDDYPANDTDEPPASGVRGDIASVSVAPGLSKTTLVSSPDADFGAVVSPDGRWVAYQSRESARDEVFVRDLMDIGVRWQVSTTGGEEPKWSPDGRQLYYRSRNRLFAVDVTSRPTFGTSRPHELFDEVFDVPTVTGLTFDVDRTGRRFLMLRPADETPLGAATIRLVLNRR